VDAVALVGTAGCDLVQEDDAVESLVDQHVVVAEARQPVRQFGQLVVVRREQRPAADLVMEILRDAPGQRDAFVGGRAPVDRGQRGCDSL
jgi:hypothetical protein